MWYVIWRLGVSPADLEYSASWQVLLGLQRVQKLPDCWVLAGQEGVEGVMESFKGIRSL